ncbi:MAG: hypothetical protein ACE37D_08830 [Pseudomonadales bacterium]
MREEKDLTSIGLEAVDRFITTFNSRDVSAWADTLHFPHVRPSPIGPIRSLANKDEYVAAFDFANVIKTGWDHSEWDYKHFLHQSPKKLHVAGQWSRYTSQGEKILSTPIVYIVTWLDGRWGIQSRFGSDYAGDDDVSGFETRAFRLYETFVSHYNNGHLDACAELLNYPHFRIEPGALNEVRDASEFKKAADHIQIDGMMAVQTGHKSMNLAVDLTLQQSGSSTARQGVINITERDGHLGIQAISLLDPNETE